MSQNPTAAVPEWFDGKKINEVLFCEDFLKQYPMVSLNGTFFTVDGYVSDENLLKKQIYDFLKPYVSTGLPKKVSILLDVLRMGCCTENLPLQTDRIHATNGTLFLNVQMITRVMKTVERMPEDIRILPNRDCENRDLATRIYGKIHYSYPIFT